QVAHLEQRRGCGSLQRLVGQCFHPDSADFRASSCAPCGQAIPDSRFGGQGETRAGDQRPQPLTLPSDEGGSDIAERSSAADTSGARDCAALVHEDGMNTSFFGEMLQTISERGRALIDRTRDRRSDAAARSHSLIELCEELLSRRGEASGVALAREIFIRYDELTTGHRIAIFEALSTRCGVDRKLNDTAE